MSENTLNNPNKSDEIDLLELFRRIGRTLIKWLEALLKGVLISIVFLVRRWLPLGLSILAGIVVSYLLRSNSASLYSSDMIVKNNLIQLDRQNRDESGTTSEIIAKINKLHAFCSEGNFEALSKAISLNLEMVVNISDIGAYWLIDNGRDGTADFVDYENSHNIYDTINVRVSNTLDINVKITKGIDLNLVRDGIIKFINSDSLNQQRNRLRVKQNGDLLQRVNFDILLLDSLQKVKYFEETRNLKPSKEGQIVFMQEQKTQLLYPDVQRLYEKKQSLEKEQDLYKSIVTIINDFSLPTRRVNGVMFYGRKIIPVFFLGTLLFLILIANRHKLVETYKKY